MGGLVYYENIMKIQSENKPWCVVYVRLLRARETKAGLQLTLAAKVEISFSKQAFASGFNDSKCQK